jgi:transposase InsO family protein
VLKRDLVSGFCRSEVDGALSATAARTNPSIRTKAVNTPAWKYQQLLAQHRIIGSLSRRANCWDNAVAESFFAAIKVELVYQAQRCTRVQARSAIFEYIELFL